MSVRGALAAGEACLGSRGQRGGLQRRRFTIPSNGALVAAPVWPGGAAALGDQTDTLRSTGGQAGGSITGRTDWDRRGATDGGEVRACLWGSQRCADRARARMWGGQAGRGRVRPARHRSALLCPQPRPQRPQEPPLCLLCLSSPSRRKAGVGRPRAPTRDGRPDGQQEAGPGGLLEPSAPALVCPPRRLLSRGE